MGRALELALGGWGRVAPNPLVGAVVLRGADGVTVGEGSHEEYGGPHAEVLALRIDADPCGQLRVCRLLVEVGDGVENCEARARGTLSIVVMRLRIPEVSHDPVAEIFRDVPIETGYRFGRYAMIARHRLAPFLGIELRRDRR